MKKILAIDGGGIKGVFSAAYLADLEERLNGRHLYEYFDIIAGTSTGGIIAAALTLGIPAQDILQLYLSNGRKIFTPNNRLTVLFKSAYDSKNLKEVLDNVFGEKTFNDCKTRLLLPAFNIETGKVRVFKTQHHKTLYIDGNTKIVDCLMATTAAPTYFRPFVGERGTYIDGGVGANNPSMIGLIEALTKCEWKLDDISILNIGGIDVKPTKGNEKMVIIDIKKIVDCFMSSEAQIVKKSCRLLLGDRYKCVEYKPCRVIKMDCVSDENLRKLVIMGRQHALEDIHSVKTTFLNEGIEPPVFYN